MISVSQMIMQILVYYSIQIWTFTRVSFQDQKKQSCPLKFCRLRWVTFSVEHSNAILTCTPRKKDETFRHTSKCNCNAPFYRCVGFISKLLKINPFIKITPKFFVFFIWNSSLWIIEYRWGWNIELIIESQLTASPIIINYKYKLQLFVVQIVVHKPIRSKITF